MSQCALARDLLLHYGHDVPIARATSDIDLGVAVAHWQEFQQLHDACARSDHFTYGNPASHRLKHSSNIPLDLIPFGDVERPDGTIEWPNENTVMGVLDYKEAYATATLIQLPNEISALTVCLPMLAILKLMAWSERKTYTPRKDASDLFLVLTNYLTDTNVERLYEAGADLLDNDDFDFQVAGAWLAGHDVALCIRDYGEQPSRLRDAVMEILETEANPNADLRLAGEMGERAEIMLKLLASFREGMNDSVNLR